jgi:hypothetical protein
MTYRATITHFDTAMTLIEVGSLRLLTDPVFDHAGSSFDHGPRSTRRQPRSRGQGNALECSPSVDDARSGLTTRRGERRRARRLAVGDVNRLTGRSMGRHRGACATWPRRHTGDHGSSKRVCDHS